VCQARTISITARWCAACVRGTHDENRPRPPCSRSPPGPRARSLRPLRPGRARERAKGDPRRPTRP
jgi:hypothetical protein